MNRSSDGSCAEILLVFQIGVGGDQYGKAFVFRRLQEFAVFECGPASLESGYDFVFDQVSTQGRGCAGGGVLHFVASNF